jgi:hypothetical protein
LRFDDQIRKEMHRGIESFNFDSINSIVDDKDSKLSGNDDAVSLSKNKTNSPLA